MQDNSATDGVCAPRRPPAAAERSRNGRVNVAPAAGSSRRPAAEPVDRHRAARFVCTSFHGTRKRESTRMTTGRRFEAGIRAAAGVRCEVASASRANEPIGTARIIIM